MSEEKHENIQREIVNWQAFLNRSVYGLCSSAQQAARVF